MGIDVAEAIAFEEAIEFALQTQRSDLWKSEMIILVLRPCERLLQVAGKLIHVPTLTEECKRTCNKEDKRVEE